MGKYGLQFDALETDAQFSKLADFMRTHPGSYDVDAHNAWVEEVCLPELTRGERVALGWMQDESIIGDAVIKVAGPDTVELKNFRVAGPEMLRGLGLGSTLLKVAMSEAVELLVARNAISSEARSINMILDTTEGTPAAEFFEHAGFVTYGRAELYTPGVHEVLMSRQIALV